MKRAVLGSLIVLGLVIATVATGQPRGDAGGQRVPLGPAAVGGSELIVVPMSLAEKGQQMLTVVDPRQRTLAVYQIDPAGKIVLRSVRNITFDLQMEYYNNEGLLPREIRSMSETK